LSHLVCLPINVGLLFYACSIYTGSSTLGLLVLAWCGFWYLRMAVRFRAIAWGALSLAVLLGLWTLGDGCASMARAAGVPWYLEPILLIALVSTAQAGSHGFERNVPPRANFSERWRSTREFVWGETDRSSLERLRRVAWIPVGAVWGAFDEWWASTKLLPIYLLELMWVGGYEGAKICDPRQQSLAALASGDPALDWVGVGGGASLDDQFK
jgi:hypothetical protein